MSQLFPWSGQSTGVSASASFPPSFLPKTTQGWSPLEWTGWISLQSKGLSRVFSNTTVQKYQFFGDQLSSQVRLVTQILILGFPKDRKSVNTILITKAHWIRDMYYVPMVCHVIMTQQYDVTLHYHARELSVFHQKHWMFYILFTI